MLSCFTRGADLFALNDNMFFPSVHKAQRRDVALFNYILPDELRVVSL
jgi:hypothetical protein